MSAPAVTGDLTWRCVWARVHVCVCVCVDAVGQCATSDTLTDRARGRVRMRAGVHVLGQPDTASHTLSVF